MSKLITLAAFGAGYVLGAKAGRERYEQINRTFTKVKDNPKVQQRAHQAADLAREKAPHVKDKVSSVAGTAVGKVRGSDGAHTETDPLASGHRTFDPDPHLSAPMS